MPIHILADGFFDAAADAASDAESPANFKLCAAAAAVQASWFRAAVVDAAAEVQETFAVVYVGDPEALLDNDRMAALRSALPAVFEGDTMVVASSPQEGRIELHGEVTGDDLLRRAAVVGVVQAAALWDQTLPLTITNAHRTVSCRPRVDPETKLWTSSVERSGP